MFDRIRGILCINTELALDLLCAHLTVQKILVKLKELVSMHKQFLHNRIIEILFLVKRRIRSDRGNEKEVLKAHVRRLFLLDIAELVESLDNLTV